MNFSPAQEQYLNYLQAKWPQIYRSIVLPQMSAMQISGIGDTPTQSGNFFTNLLNSISGAIPQLSQTYAQIQDAKAQAELAELQRQTMLLQAQQAQGGGFGGMSTSTILMLAAAGLIGVVLIARR